jgi:hypothetical protein
MKTALSLYVRRRGLLDLHLPDDRGNYRNKTVACRGMQEADQARGTIRPEKYYPPLHSDKATMASCIFARGGRWVGMTSYVLFVHALPCTAAACIRSPDSPGALQIPALVCNRAACLYRRRSQLLCISAQSPARKSTQLTPSPVAWKIERDTELWRDAVEAAGGAMWLEVAAVLGLLLLPRLRARQGGRPWRGSRGTSYSSSCS